MTSIYSVWDMKGSDPIHFADRVAAVEFCDGWIDRMRLAKGNRDDVRKVDRVEEIDFFIGPLRIFMVRKSRLYATAAEGPKRDDYPRVAL